MAIAIVAGLVAFMLALALAYTLGKPKPKPKDGGILGIVEGLTGLKL